MAITALSGQRWQGGVSGATSNSWDFSSDTGWTKTGDRWFVDTGDSRVESLAYSSYAPNDYVWYDMGASFHALDSDFTIRCKILAVGAGGYIQVGFTDNTTNGDGGDSLNMGLNTYNTAYGYTRIYDSIDGTMHEVATATTVTPSGMYNTAIYMEFAYNSTTSVATVKCFSDSDFSTPLNAATQNLSATLTPANYDSLRYLFIGSIVASGRSLDSGCYVTDLVVTTSGTPDRDSVTDVPVGSEFEQTNDYKNYQFDGTNWVERGTAI